MSIDQNKMAFLRSELDSTTLSIERNMSQGLIIGDVILGKAEEAIPYLLEILKNDGKRSQSYAAQALGELRGGAKEVVEPLLEIAQNESDFNKKFVFVSSLMLIEGQGGKGFELMEEMKPHLMKWQIDKLQKIERETEIPNRIEKNKNKLLKIVKEKEDLVVKKIPDEGYEVAGLLLWREEVDAVLRHLTENKNEEIQMKGKDLSAKLREIRFMELRGEI